MALNVAPSALWWHTHCWVQFLCAWSLLGTWRSGQRGWLFRCLKPIASASPGRWMQQSQGEKQGKTLFKKSCLLWCKGFWDPFMCVFFAKAVITNCLWLGRFYNRTFIFSQSGDQKAKVKIGKLFLLKPLSLACCVLTQFFLGDTCILSSPYQESCQTGSVPLRITFFHLAFSDQGPISNKFTFRLGIRDFNIWV